MRQVASIALTLLCGACTINGVTPEQYLINKNLRLPTAEQFDHCAHYGCAHVTQVPLTKDDWRAIKKAYGGKAKDAVQEREKIAKAIAAFENIIGAKTGTQNDEGGTFQNMGDGQMDCVDESVNTTSYLLLLRDKGWLKFHEVAPINARFPLIHSGGWPHQSAMIRENDSDQRWMVDSWFHDNGAPPEIMTLQDWLAGYKPERKIQSNKDKAAPNAP